MKFNSKQLPLYIGIFLVVALAAFILLSKFKYGSDYSIIDTYKIDKNNEKGAIYFVKVKEFDVEKLRAYSKEITTKYLNGVSSIQGNAYLIIQFFKEASDKPLDSIAMKKLQADSPNLVSKAQNLHYVENGYMYRAVFSNSPDPVASLVKSDLFIPANGAKAQDLLN